MAGREGLREPRRERRGHQPARAGRERMKEKIKGTIGVGIGSTGLQELVDRTVRYSIGHVMRKYKALQK